jgi:hypothetical protein
MHESKPAPANIAEIRRRVLRAISPIKPANDDSEAAPNFLSTAKITNAGRSLPDYFLCYFMLVDLLGFKNLGRFEKIAWSVPIDFNGRVFLIEHRKFGVGLFASDQKNSESEAKEIVYKIKKGVKMAQPFFDWLARQAADGSNLNVKNHHPQLFERLTYFLNLYRAEREAAIQSADGAITTSRKNDATNMLFAGSPLQRTSEWIAMAAIDAFFAWTEHAFVHCAILKQAATTGTQVKKLAESDWGEKFKSSIEIKDKSAKYFYDQLLTVKKQLRNYMAHGAFGKNGEAFYFHSGAGAVPMLLPYKKRSGRFCTSEDLAFDDDKTIMLIQDFIGFFWQGDREPAKIYVDSGLPSILEMAENGTYGIAMRSIEGMRSLVDHLTSEFDNAANMDW